MAFIK